MEHFPIINNRLNNELGIADEVDVDPQPQLCKSKIAIINSVLASRSQSSTRRSEWAPGPGLCPKDATVRADVDRAFSWCRPVRRDRHPAAVAGSPRRRRRCRESGCPLEGVRLLQNGAKHRPAIGASGASARMPAFFGQVVGQRQAIGDPARGAGVSSGMFQPPLEKVAMQCRGRLPLHDQRQP